MSGYEDAVTASGVGDVNIEILLSGYHSPEKQEYVVRSGDVLAKIAARTKTTPELIMRTNNLTSTMLHVGQSDLPFGGAGPSGIGAYHGREGFETFTKKKPVFYQSRLAGTHLLYPPYKERIDWLLKFLLGK